MACPHGGKPTHGAGHGSLQPCGLVNEQPSSCCRHFAGALRIIAPSGPPILSLGATA